MKRAAHLVLAAVIAGGCGSEAPLNDETLARERFIRDLAEREGVGEMWYVMPRADVVFEDGFSATQMVDPDPALRWTEVPRTVSSERAIPVRWLGPQAHLRVRARGRDMHLRIWGRSNLAVLFARPRLTATFDGLEFWSRVVDESGEFMIEAVIPADWVHGWSDVYLELSTVSEPWREPGLLRAARVEGVSWEPVP
jgi:hypothetical protein